MKPLTVRRAVPVIFQYRGFDAAGGLLCYGSSETEYCRLIDTYSSGEFLPALAAPPKLPGARHQAKFPCWLQPITVPRFNLEKVELSHSQGC
jgi:hypothetical protein